MKNKKVRKIIRFFSAIILIGGLVYIGNEFYNRHKSKIKVEEEQNISQNIADEVGISNQENKKNKDKEIQASNEYIDKMKKELNNEDVIGRLEFKKLNLDHVLVHSHDNQEYLNLDVRRNWFYTGSIFLDKDNADTFTDFNSRIFGHRILDGSFFGSFNKFFDQNFVDEGNNYFKLTTKLGVKYYDIVAILDIDQQDNNLPLEASDEFINYLYNNSVVNINKENKKITHADNIVSLVSCKPMGLTHSTRRIVIVGLERK